MQVLIEWRSSGSKEIRVLEFGHFMCRDRKKITIFVSLMSSM